MRPTPTMNDVSLFWISTWSKEDWHHTSSLWSPNRKRTIEYFRSFKLPDAADGRHWLLITIKVSPRLYTRCQKFTETVSLYLARIQKYSRLALSRHMARGSPPFIHNTHDSKSWASRTPAERRMLGQSITKCLVGSPFLRKIFKNKSWRVGKKCFCSFLRFFFHL